jgi:hypothetical protein
MWILDIYLAQNQVSGVIYLALNQESEVINLVDINIYPGKHFSWVIYFAQNPVRGVIHLGIKQLGRRSVSLHIRAWIGRALHLRFWDGVELRNQSHSIAAKKLTSSTWVSSNDFFSPTFIPLLFSN